MGNFQQKRLAGVAVVLYVLVCGAQSQDPTTHVPVSMLPKMDPRMNLVQQIAGLMEQMVTNNMGILDCVKNHFNTTALVHQISTEFPGNMTEETFDKYTRVAMEVFCRDYASPLLTCLDKTINSGSSKLDVILKNVLDFPRLHAMLKYGCSKIDAISSNMVCVQKKVAEVMSANSTQNPVVILCLNTVYLSAETLTRNPDLQVDENLFRGMMKLSVDYANCMKPAMEGCGEYSEVFNHMNQEIAYMYRGERLKNSGLQTTGNTLLLATVVSVYIGLWH